MLGARGGPGDRRAALPGGTDWARLARSSISIIAIVWAAGIVYALATTDRAALARLGELDAAPLLLAVALTFVPWLAGMLRVRNWLRAWRVVAPTRQALRVIVATELGAAITPRAIGGAPAKVAALAGSGLSGGQALTLLALSAIEDAVFTFLVVPVLLWRTAVWQAPLFQRVWSLTPTRVLLPAGLLLLIAAALWLRGRQGSRLLLAGRQHLVRLLREMRTALGFALRRHRRLLAINIALALLQWAARYSIASALMASFGLPVDPWRCAALQWLCFAAMNLAPTPGSAGGAEALFLLLYSGVLPEGTLGVIMLGWRWVTFYLPMLAALALVPLLLRAPADRKPAGGEPALPPLATPAGAGSQRL